MKEAIGVYNQTADVRLDKCRKCHIDFGYCACLRSDQFVTELLRRGLRVFCILFRIRIAGISEEADQRPPSPRAREGALVFFEPEPR